MSLTMNPHRTEGGSIAAGWSTARSLPLPLGEATGEKYWAIVVWPSLAFSFVGFDVVGGAAVAGRGGGGGAEELAVGGGMMNSRRSTSSITPKTRNSSTNPTTGISRCENEKASQQSSFAASITTRTARPVSNSVSSATIVLSNRNAHHCSFPTTATLTGSASPITSFSSTEWTALPLSKMTSLATVRWRSSGIKAPVEEMISVGRWEGGRWAFEPRR